MTISQKPDACTDCGADDVEIHRRYDFPFDHKQEKWVCWDCWAPVIDKRLHPEKYEAEILREEQNEPDGPKQTSLGDW